MGRKRGQGEAGSGVLRRGRVDRQNVSHLLRSQTKKHLTATGSVPDLVKEEAGFGRVGESSGRQSERAAAAACLEPGFRPRS